MFKGFLILTFLLFISCSRQKGSSEQYKTNIEYSVVEQVDNEIYDQNDIDGSTKLGARIKANLRLILFVIF